MREILGFFANNGWDILGILIIVGMLMWVTNGKRLLEQRRKERLAEKAYLDELQLGADQGLTRFTPLPGQTSKN